MKRFWLVMLSVGLVLAFSASAMAVDVKFSGSFYAAGMYQDRTTFRSTYDTVAGHAYDDGDGYGLGGSVGPSTAFYYQRLRVQTDFIVSPGLKLVTRFDAMERIWGGARGDAFLGTGAATDRPAQEGANYANSQSAGTRSESQNIAIDLAYISYTSPIGLFSIGYQPNDSWGTVFGNDAETGAPIGKISYTVPIGPVYINATISKKIDNSYSAVASTNQTDSDYDTWSIGAIYVPKKDIQIGLLAGYKRVATGRFDPLNWTTQDSIIFPNEGDGWKASAWGFTPYVKAKFGMVSVEAELNYAFGKVEFEDGSLGPYGLGEIDIRNLTAYVNAGVDVGMFYGGATFAYVSGDDSATRTKLEGGFLEGGLDYQPTLIMFNSDRTYWAGKIPGYGYVPTNAYLGSFGPTPTGGVLANAWLYQGKVGVRPIPALDINASLTYANADKKANCNPSYDPTDPPILGPNTDYGWEIDVTATYKITNNLSYMLGGAYLFTGDYYKGIQGDDVENNFLLINKLTLTF